MNRIPLVQSALAPGPAAAGTIALIVVLLLASVQTILGAEYKIGPEDVLEVSFWQDETLSSTVRVGQDGKITLNVIGQIQAAGKTTEELQDEIVRLMSRLNKNISQAVVRVQAYNYQYLFVTGQVRSPGKRTFEEIPDLWTIINEAGGVGATADLSRVTIIRGGQDAGKVEVVNVSNAIATGTIDKLPKIRRQDTIDIPPTTGGVGTADLAQSAEMKNVIYVVGAVNLPGPKTFEENVDVMDALALAGGPQANANLKKVKIISRDGYYAQTYQVNLEKYARSGKPARYILRREDTFVVPTKGQGFFGAGLNVGTVGTVIGVVSSVITIKLLIDQNNRDRQTQTSGR